jgi:serine/threonine protein kinase/WD40 repeat protein
MADLNDLIDATRHLSNRIDRDRAIDEICRRFEATWSSDRSSCIEDCLAAAGQQIREELLFELVAVEVELRQSAGESPTRDEYVSRFPEDEQVVTAAFEEALRVDDSAPASHAVSLPERFGEFRIVREIGRGGMGVVYEAEQESLRRRVALKSLLRQYDSRSPVESRKRFRREARAIARLHHSNIVDVFGDGEHDGVPYFAMRLIDGSGLDQMIASIRLMADTQREAESKDQSTTRQGAIETEDRRQGLGVAASEPRESREAQAGESVTLPRRGTGAFETELCVEKSDSQFDWRVTDAGTGETEFRLPFRGAERAVLAAKIGHSIASALQYAHDCGVLHRDVKPSNILIDRDGTAWLTDFGLAQLSGSATLDGLTLDGSIMGTLRYLSPESLGGEVSAGSDQYALGLTLFELIALRPAFDRQERAGLLRDIEQCARPALDVIAPDTPRDLVTIIHKAIDREPSARYARIGELGDDLRRFLNDEPIRARRISKVEQLSRWRRRNRGLAASLSAVAVLLLVVAVGSAIAAGYFGRLSAKLKSTVDELTETATELTARTSALTARTKELTVARKSAEAVASENLKLAREAELARDRAEDTVYFSRIALADRAWLNNDVHVARALLRKCLPQSNEPDRRGWEWHYLDSLCNSNVVFLDRSTGHRSGYFYDVRFSPDGRWLATGSSVPWEPGGNSDLAIWDTRDYSLLRRDEVSISAPDGIRFSSDSRSIALLDSSGAVTHAAVVETGDVIPLDQIDSADFDVSEALVAEFDSASERPVVLRNPQNGDVVATLSLQSGLQDVRASGDGKLVATAGDNAVVQVWDVATAKPTRILRGHDRTAYSAAFSPTDFQMASVALDGIRIWDLTRNPSHVTLRVPHTVSQGERLIDFAFTPDGRELIGIELSDDSMRIGRSRVATGEQLQFSNLKDLNLLSGQQRALTICPTIGQFILPLRRDPATVAVCDLDTGRILHTLTHPSEFIVAAEFSRDGEMIATGYSQRSSIRLWNAETGRLIRQLGPIVETTGDEQSAEQTPVLAFSQSSNRLACCYAMKDGIQVWDTATGELVCRLSADPALRPMSCSFSADGRQLAVGFLGSAGIGIFDLQEKRLHLRLIAGEGSDGIVEFSPTENRLATTGRDGSTSLWDTRTGELILRLNSSVAARFNYGFGPRVHWSPDGRRLAANNWLGQIDVWETSEPDQSQADRLAIAEMRSILWFIEQAGIAIESGDLAAGLRQAGKVRDRSNLAPGIQIARGFLWARLGKWELAAADLYPRGPHTPAFRRLVSEHTDQSDELLTNAAMLRPDVPELQIALADRAERNGDHDAFDEHRRLAVSLLERELAERPTDTFVARQLAEVIRSNEEKIRWQPLRIQSAKSAGGATLSIQKDGSILASGNNVPGDVYTVTAPCDAERVFAVRLDVLPDPSLPNRGPGRHPSGNFKLDEIRLLNCNANAGSPDESHVFSDAWASFQFPAPDVNVLGTIQHDDPRVWHVWSKWGLPHHAVFKLKEPVTIQPDQPLVIELRHHTDPDLTLGRFRLSVSPTPFVTRNLVEQVLLDTNWQPPFLALAAIRISAGQYRQAAAALQQVPETENPAEIAVRLLLLTRLAVRLEQSDRVSDACDRLIKHLRDNPLPSPYEWLNPEFVRSEFKLP